MGQLCRTDPRNLVMMAQAVKPSPSEAGAMRVCLFFPKVWKVALDQSQSLIGGKTESLSIFLNQLGPKLQKTHLKAFRMRRANKLIITTEIKPLRIRV
jgi:hypothetical protein